MSWGSGQKKQESLGLTKETQKLLEGVMQQRGGLSQRAMQDIASSLQRGDSAWVDRLNTGTAAFRQAKSKATTLVKAPKVGSGSGGAAAPPPLPGRWSGKKMAHEIMRDTPPEREMWVGGAPPPNREAEKDRLSRLMELGPKGVKEFEARAASMKQEALARAARAQRMDVKEEMIDQVIDEIRERREFLESMRAAGRGEQYEAAIRTEIQIRMRELERLGLETK